MKPHMTITSIPIKGYGYFITNVWTRRIIRQHMNHIKMITAFNGICNGNRLAIGKGHGAAVTGLTAPHGVKHRLIKAHPFFINTNNLSLTLF